jgi:beta-lactamase superfamily II metal-dependent hydrolase
MDIYSVSLLPLLVNWRLGAAANPSVAIIFVDTNNRYGLPSPTVLGQLVGRTILRTDQHGSIETGTDGAQL